MNEEGRGEIPAFFMCCALKRGTNKAAGRGMYPVPTLHAKRELGMNNTDGVNTPSGVRNKKRDGVFTPSLPFMQIRRSA